MDTHNFFYNAGKSVVILKNQLKALNHLSATMNELESHIPQFHRQPGLMRQFDKGFDDLKNSINCVLNLIEIKEDSESSSIWGSDDED